MLFQLVLISTVGVMTPIATFQTQQECSIQQKVIQPSPNYSIVCLPSNPPPTQAQMKQQIDANMQVLLGAMNTFKQFAESMDQK